MHGTKPQISFGLLCSCAYFWPVFCTSMYLLIHSLIHVFIHLHIHKNIHVVCNHGIDLFWQVYVKHVSAK